MYGIEIKLNDQWSSADVEDVLASSGMASPLGPHGMKLVRTCHVATVGGRTFIFHFKEVFGVCGRPATITESDIFRRDAIIRHLESLGCFSLIDELPSSNDDMAFVGFTVVGGDEPGWTLKSKLLFFNKESQKWTIEMLRPTK